MGTVPHLSRVGHLFLKCFLKRLFSLKVALLEENCSQNEPKITYFGSYFLEKCQNGKVCLDCAGVYGLHMSPSRGALRTTQKSKRKRDIFQNRFFFSKNWKYVKKELQKVSQRVSLFRWWRLFGGSWDTFGDPSRFLTPKVRHHAPKVHPGTENYLKNDTKCPQRPKIISKMTPKVKKIP